MNQTLYNIVKCIVNEQGESILGDPTRLKKVFQDRAVGIDSLDRAAFGWCIQRGAYKELRAASTPHQRVLAKAALADLVHAAKNVEVARCRDALDVVEMTLYGHVQGWTAGKPVHDQVIDSEEGKDNQHGPQVGAIDRSLAIERVLLLQKVVWVILLAVMVLVGFALQDVLASEARRTLHGGLVACAFAPWVLWGAGWAVAKLCENVDRYHALILHGLLHHTAALGVMVVFVGGIALVMPTLFLVDFHVAVFNGVLVGGTLLWLLWAAASAGWLLAPRLSRAQRTTRGWITAIIVAVLFNYLTPMGSGWEATAVAVSGLVLTPMLRKIAKNIENGGSRPT